MDLILKRGGREMVGPGMTEEVYGKLSKRGRVVYWVVVFVFVLWVACEWF
jgi:hypothetical protein